MATVTVDVDIDMADLGDDELIDELKDRGYAIMGTKEDAQDVFPLLLQMGYPESLIREMKAHEHCPWLMGQQLAHTQSVHR